MKMSIGFLVIFLVIGFSVSAFCCETAKSTAQHDAYFDSATGHKYIKNANSTYNEYSKKGKLLKDAVPCTQPHLSKSPYILPIEKNCYILYEKTGAPGKNQLVLPATSKHPDGWRSRKLFYSSDYNTHTGLVQVP